MLAEATVNAKVDGKDASMTIKEIFDDQMQIAKVGGSKSYEVQAFHPMTRRIQYKPLQKITQYRDNNNVIKLNLDMGKNDKQEQIVYSVILSVTSQVYMNYNGRPTTVPLNGLKTYGINKLQVAYVEGDGKTIKYCPILSYSDPIKEIEEENRKLLQAKALEDAKTDGRKKKKEIVLKAVPVYDVFKGYTPDGSYFIVDGLIIK